MSAPFGVYVHVPFCVTRCGYCDFNTYTATELGPGATPTSYVESALAEIALARRALAGDQRPVSTVFVGGGTPTVLPPAHLVQILGAIEDAFGLDPAVEVTTEANPESVDAAALAALREGGFTRVSFGMQSAREHVLQVLDRRHTPGRVQQCVRDAYAAGFEHVSVDLIYGAPGETDDDWRASVEAALATGADHVSAYALVVEHGTRLAAQVRRGDLAVPEDDVLADRYVIAEDLLSAAGLRWYEISNWARIESAQCRHNLGYWRGGDWWGIGPGAHSHLAGRRWWNVKHPAAYAARLAAAAAPEEAHEVLDPDARHVEDVMLRLRLREGLPVADLTPAEQARAAEVCTEGLVDATAYAAGRLVLTMSGRLLADAVVRRLLG